MSIQAPEKDELFTSTVYFALGAQKWTNSVVFQARVDSMAYTEILEASRAFADFCIRMTCGDVLIEKHTIRTYIEDDRETFPFITEQVNEPAFVAATDVLPLDYVLIIRKNMVFGRQGGIPMRSTVLFSDVEMVDGRLAISGDALQGYQDRVVDALAHTVISQDGLAPTLVPENNTVMVVPSRDPMQPDASREVTTLTVGELKQRQTNNRWFDRSPA
jgi:hypothetical protein